MKKKPVYQINPDDLTIIKEWESVSAAATEMSFPQPSICAAAQGKRISANGFYWCFVEDYENFKPKKRKTKQVICVETGEIFDSVKDAAQNFDCSESSIRKICLDLTRTIGREKFHIQYLEDYELFSSIEKNQEC